jgi:hypothetical protein
MKAKWIVMGMMLFFLAGCDTAGAGVDLLRPVATVGPTEQAYRSTQSVMYATATGQVVAITAEAAKYRSAMAAATSQAAQQTADAARWEATAEEQGREQRATQAAIQATQSSVVITQQADERAAQATQAAEQRAYVILQTGQAQQVTATAQSWSSTQQANGIYLSWTQEAVNRQATADAAGAQALSTSQAVQAGLASEQLKQEQLRTYVQDTFKDYWGALPLLLIVALTVMAAFGAVEWTRMRVVQRGLDGSAPVMVMDHRVVNPDRGLWPVLDPKSPRLPETATQMRVTENEQKVSAIRALAQGGKSAAGSRIAAGMANSGTEPIEEPLAEAVLPFMAPWASLETWQGGALPLGIGASRQGILLDPERTPHLLVAGTSGSGKTIDGLRPLACLALVSGWQLILMNDAGGDFAPLHGHANLIEVHGGPVEIANALEAVVDEAERRDTLLQRMGVSTWSRLANSSGHGPRLMVMIDELVSLANSANGTLSGRIWRAAIHITSKGRKFGICFVAATTDPTYRTLAQPGLIVRDNCGRMVFRVRNAAVSQAALDTHGAEVLEEHQFIAQLGTVVEKGVAFHPSDEQIREFLARRPVMALPAPDWLTVTSQDVIDERTERIRGMARTGSSMAEIQRTVFGYAGGSAFEAVRDALKGMTQGSTTCNTTTQGTEDIVF